MSQPNNAQNAHTQAPNHQHDTQNPQAQHPNVEQNSTVLEATLDEFNPAENDGAEATIDSEIDIQAFKDRIAQLEKDVDTAKRGQAQATADAYNAQHRMEQETEKAKKFALQKFVKELLDVVDNLERAIISVHNDPDADDAIMDGVKLTHKSFLTALNKQGVEVVDPQGEKFNPEYHEAVGIDPNTEADMVGEVLQKGYTLNGRSIRPAMVKVGQ